MGQPAALWWGATAPAAGWVIHYCTTRCTRPRPTHSCLFAYPAHNPAGLHFFGIVCAPHCTLWTQALMTDVTHPGKTVPCCFPLLVAESIAIKRSVGVEVCTRWKLFEESHIVPFTSLTAVVMHLVRPVRAQTPAGLAATLVEGAVPPAAMAAAAATATVPA
jgi:hypothetical protein